MNNGGTPGTESPSAAGPATAPQRVSDQAEVLLAAAQRLAEAERRGDVGALEELIAADYAGYDPAGRQQDRGSVLRSYADGRVRVTTLGQSELRARVVGEAGLVTGTSKLWRGALSSCQVIAGLGGPAVSTDTPMSR